MSQTNLVVKKLQTEYLKNPLGMDVPQPRLSWQIGSGWHGVL